MNNEALIYLIKDGDDGMKVNKVECLFDVQDVPNSMVKYTCSGVNIQGDCDNAKQLCTQKLQCSVGEFK